MLLYVRETLPSVLKKAGYKTIHVGKAHWGAIGTPGEEPLNLGFDVNIAGHAAGGRVVIMGHVISVPLFEKEVLNGMFRIGKVSWQRY